MCPHLPLSPSIMAHFCSISFCMYNVTSSVSLLSMDYVASSFSSTDFTASSLSATGYTTSSFSSTDYAAILFLFSTAYVASSLSITSFVASSLSSADYATRSFSCTDYAASLSPLLNICSQVSLLNCLGSQFTLLFYLCNHFIVLY